MFNYKKNSFGITNCKYLLVGGPIVGEILLRGKEVYQEFSEIKEHEGHWNLSSEDFSEALFNVLDNVKSVNLVEKCNENGEIYGAMNGKVCLFEHNKN